MAGMLTLAVIISNTMKPLHKTKPRAIANTPTVSEQRRSTIAACYSWIEYSIANGFYMEAVTIIESLIADRMESRLSFLLSGDVGFQMLQNLLDKLYSIESDRKLKELLKNPDPNSVEIDLQKWIKERNEIVHQAAKIEHANFIPFHIKLQRAKTSAETGKALARKIDTRVKYLRRNGI